MGEALQRLGFVMVCGEKDRSAGGGGATKTAE